LKGKEKQKKSNGKKVWANGLVMGGLAHLSLKNK
jgi:hypothetical protein